MTLLVVALLPALLILLSISHVDIWNAGFPDYLAPIFDMQYLAGVRTLFEQGKSSDWHTVMIKLLYWPIPSLMIWVLVLSCLYKKDLFFQDDWLGDVARDEAENVYEPLHWAQLRKRKKIQLVYLAPINMMLVLLFWAGYFFVLLDVNNQAFGPDYISDPNDRALRFLNSLHNVGIDPMLPCFVFYLFFVIAMYSNFFGHVFAYHFKYARNLTRIAPHISRLNKL